jgi:hypothetical protein
MENERIEAEYAQRQIEKQGEICELVIRRGEALPAKEPIQIEIFGQIDAPARWAEKRSSSINQSESYMVVNRDNMSMTLIINATNPYTNQQITGSLMMSSELKQMGVNDGEYVTTLEMADRIKMNRTCFENIQEAMKLVTELRNFKGKVEKELELSDDKRGNARVLRAQTVDSNIPEAFHINVPVFKGNKATSIEVEVEINPNDLCCTLVSPEANDIIRTQRDVEIDNVIASVRASLPEMPIIEI